MLNEPGFILPYGLLVGWIADRSRSSQSSVIRDIWVVCIREVGFVPLEVRTNLFLLCNSSDVDSF